MNQPITRTFSQILILLTFSIIGFSACNKEPVTEEAKLTYAPEVPPPITRKNPAKVIINLETQEVVGRLADGVE